MRVAYFRITPGSKEGQETKSVKMKKYEEYKKILMKDGFEIVSEEEVNSRRGKLIKIEYKTR